MAADQRKKRPKSSGLKPCGSGEQHRAKRKKLDSLKHGLNMRPHITLQWDQNEKRVVPQREQIGMKWRDLTQFVDSVPHHGEVLADICAVPQEILELGNLSEVLSYEVWLCHLSEEEKEFLKQFLPLGVDSQEVLEGLLGGANFHFGNPFSEWSASLCSGKLHPDVVLHQEKCLKANKKLYCSELQKYHNGIIGKVQKWKERWSSCKNPDKDFKQKLGRLRSHSNKIIYPDGNESSFVNPERNVQVASGSCSWSASDKTCSSDNQNSVVNRQKSQGRKCHVKQKHGIPLAIADEMKSVVTVSKGEKLIREAKQSDAGRYMSYIKITKRQHQLLKNMKTSSTSVQPKALTRILGDLDSFQAHPYEQFEEEERKKLHDYWVQLANVDLPEAYLEWRKGLTYRERMTKSLEEELEEKLKSLRGLAGQTEESPCAMLQEQNSLEENVETSSEDDNIFHTAQDQALQRIPSLNVSKIIEGGHETTNEYDFESVPCFENKPLQQFPSLNGSKSSEEDHQTGGDDESVPSSTVNEPSQQILSLEGIHQFNSSYMVPDDNLLILEQGDGSNEVSEYSRNLSPINISGSQGVPLSSSEDVWPIASEACSYFPDSRQEYAPTNELSLGHSQIDEDQQHPSFIDLEPVISGELMGKNTLHQESNNGPLDSYFNQDHDELQSFFKGRDIAPYHHPRRQVGSGFEVSNTLRGTENYPGCFEEQVQVPLAVGQMNDRQNELYAHQNMQQGTYPDEVGYFIPRQEQVLPVNLQDWGGRMAAPPGARSTTGGLLSQNLFPGGHLVRRDMYGPDGSAFPRQETGFVNNGEGSLFSVLSQCHELRSGNPYNIMSSAQQLVPSGSLGAVGSGIVRNNNALQQATLPLDYLNGHETGAGSSSNMGWMSYPRQNSVVHDLMGKSYLRSGNQ